MDLKNFIQRFLEYYKIRKIKTEFITIFAIFHIFKACFPEKLQMIWEEEDIFKCLGPLRSTGDDLVDENEESFAHSDS